MSLTEESLLEFKKRWLEERKNYYYCYYEVKGLPENISYSEFFDIEMLDSISGDIVLYISSDGWIELIKAYFNNQQYMDKLVELVCQKGCYIESKNFNTLLQNSEIAVSFMNSFIKYIEKSYFIKDNSIALIFNNEYLLNQILNNKQIDINSFSGIFSNYKLNKEVFLKLLNDERFFNIFFNYRITDFFEAIKNKGLELELNDLIQLKINSLSYMEKIDFVGNYYNPQIGSPECLKELYFIYGQRINLNKKRKKIIYLNQASSEEDKESVKAFISTNEGRELFLKEIFEPQFSNVIKILNLSSDFYQERKDILFNELKEYKKYDISTIKNLLCMYCFEENYHDVVLKLKTLIQYTNENANALLLLRDDIKYIIKLYSYLTIDNSDIEPLELVSNIDINDLILKAHTLFSSEINKKTDISDILSSDKFEEKNGVKVIDVDIPLDRSYFLVHSVSGLDLKNNSLEYYLDMANKYNRICTSVLDNDHTKTFLDGVVFGYCNIEAPMYSAVPFDGQTNQRNRNVVKPQFRSILTDVDDFLKRTTSEYNELTYMTDNKVIMPSYVFVANRDPNELEYRVAREFDIPIVLYHTKNVEYNLNENDDNDKKEYFCYKVEMDYIPSDSYQELYTKK